jgi:hypothetical protein
MHNTLLAEFCFATENYADVEVIVLSPMNVALNVGNMQTMSTNIIEWFLSKTQKIL